MSDTKKVQNSKQSFYDFLQECAKNNDHVCNPYAVTLLKRIENLENFPKQNRDKKTIEISLHKAMGDNYDEFLIDYLWKEYQENENKKQFFNKYF